MKMVDSTAISGQIFLILMPDQFSSESNKIIAKLYELFFRSFSSLKKDQLQILQTVHLKTAVTSKKKVASFYVERIDLASKLR